MSDIWSQWFSGDHYDDDAQISEALQRADRCPECDRRPLRAEESDSLLFSGWKAYCANGHSWDIPS